MHKAADVRILAKTTVPVNNFDYATQEAPSRVDAAFRFADFWRSRRGYLSGTDVDIIPVLVPPNPTAGSAVIGQAATPACPACEHLSSDPIACLSDARATSDNGYLGDQEAEPDDHTTDQQLKVPRRDEFNAGCLEIHQIARRQMASIDPCNGGDHAVGSRRRVSASRSVAHDVAIGQCRLLGQPEDPVRKAMPPSR